jgi:sigma-B regulation protein RsbU (phosphoserine phosphatase)
MMGRVPLSLISRIMDGAPYDIVVINADGIIDYVNGHFASIVDLPVDQIISQSIESFPIELAPWNSMSEYKARVFLEEEWRGEKSYRGLNGRMLWGYVHLIPVKDDDGVFRYFLLTNVDITARVEAEEALKKSENRFRSIVQNINEYIYSVEYINGKPGKTYHSPRCYDVTGYSPSEFDRDPNLWFAMVFPEDRLKVSEFLDNINTPYQMSYIEHRIVHKKERIRWVSNSCALHRDIEGNILRMDGFIQDITTRKETMEQLRKLSLAIEQSPSSVVITDKDGMIEYVNPKFTRLTGYQSSEVIGKNPRILKSGFMTREAYREMWNIILAGEEWQGEFHNRKKNGEYYWEFASISPLRNSRREITHFVSVKEDITERKKAEEALRISEEQLRHRNEIMEDDLRYAQKVQLALLPSVAPVNDAFKICYRFQPLDKVGGDYFSFMPYEESVRIFIGDVSGHGVSAALFSSLLKFTTEKVAEESGYDPASFLESLNKILCRNMSNYFLTAIYGYFERTPAGISFRFANGGHPPLIRYSARTRKAESITGKGSILGIFDVNTFEEKSVTLEKGDRIFLYTDGIPETKNGDNMIIGFDEMPGFIERAYDKNLDTLLDNILLQTALFRGETPIEDDIVLIGCEIL